MNNKVEVLWSGGFDSTFMLCFLARNTKSLVQPYYLDIDRSIRRDERSSLSVLQKVMRRFPELNNIRSVKIVPQKFFVPGNDVVSAWNKYSGEPYKIGGQQKFISEFSKKHIGIAWGQERYFDTPGHMTRLLLEKGNWKFTSDGVGYFDKDVCDKDVFVLFGNLVCPIAKFSERMMWEKIIEWGYRDIFRHIKFCYYPIDGKPCGMCIPCQVKMRQKMDFLFDGNAVRRYEVYNHLKQNDRCCLDSVDKKDIALDVGNILLSDLFFMYFSPLYLKSWETRLGGKDNFLYRSFCLKVKKLISLYEDYFNQLLN